ncbi:MAG TPA: DUF6518 family protein [Thermoleophilaceae bacterium]|nr:DUF6518 family protein [Thermoleophilaceae bacterium]
MRLPRRDSILTAVVAGLVLGLATRYVWELPREWHWLAKVGVPWLAAAFAVGALTREPRRGAVNGAAALVAAVVVYYLPAILGLTHTSYASNPVGLGWIGVGAPGGALFGALGALYAAGRARVVATTVLAAALGGEAILFALLVPSPGRPGTYLLAAAIAVPFLLLRRARERALAVCGTALLAGAAVVAEGGVFAVTRYVG